jgi:hypothetical protein
LTSINPGFLPLTGLAAGQSIIVTALKAADLAASYGSDASVDFVSYIQDPSTSMDMVQRLLVKRYVHFKHLCILMMTALNRIWSGK